MTPERWRLVEQTYQAALACEGASRDAFLAAACKDDAALRTEVGALVDAHEALGSFGEQPLRVPPSAVFKRLPPGTLLGSYRIETLLGAGGMGEVYRARDSKLDRVVAIKILPDAFTEHPERRARFEREARLLATLNHSNIGQIYGLEDAGSIQALVMEFVPGQTLAEALVGAISISRALTIIRQITEALSAAHQKGIIHRDVKPANIIIQGDFPKLIDFGLAKELPVDPPVSAVTASRANSISTLGEVVGTTAYMSPEQARGEPLDVRTDLFSLGAVLYEMVTGRPTVAGSTPAVVFDAILREAPPSPRSVNPAVPISLERIILKLLQKNRDARYQTASEVSADLKQMEQDPSSSNAVAHLMSERRRWGFSLGAVAMIALALAMLTWWGAGRSTLPARLEYQQVTALSDFATSPALSPDGRMVAFVRGPSTFVGQGQIYVKQLPDGEPIQLTNDTLQKMNPVFSPDGSRIAYTTMSDDFSQWNTWVVSVLARDPRLLLANASGLSWIGDQRVMFSEMGPGFHMKVVSATEVRDDIRTVYDPIASDGMAHFSTLSPDGKWVLIVEMVADHVWLPCRVVPADGSSRGRRIGPDGPCTSAAWSPDGRSVYLSSASSGTGRIWRQRFPDGVPEQITDGPTEEDGIAPDPDGGSLLTSVGSRARSVWIHDATGLPREISGEGYAFLPMFPHSVSQPFSSDSRRLFYLVRKRRIHFKGAADRSGELWMTDLTTRGKESVLPGREVTSYDLSRDGQRIVFAALDEAGKSRLWLARLDRGAPPKQLSSLEADSPRFDPSGDIFYRVAEGPSQLGFIYRMAADGSNPRKVIEAPIMYFSSVSPDGAWLVATVAVTGDDSSIAVVAFAASTGKPVPVCVSCAVDWTSGPGTKLFVVRFGSDDQTSFGGQTFVIALKPGQMLPSLPARGIRSESNLTKEVPGFREIPGFIYPSENTSVYAEVRGTFRRNIFRVPLQ